jgi:hypothetical protein
MVTREELENIRDPNTSEVKISVLHGNMHLPRWDKLLLATSPSNAATFFQYHNNYGTPGLKNHTCTLT